MAESTEQNDLQVVYLYDTKKPTHPLTGSTKLAKGVALQPGQTTIAPIDEKENFFNGQGWTDKLVIAYEFDTDNNYQYTGPVMIPEGQVLAANQTFVKPKDGLYWPIRFNGTEWIGITKEEFEKAHPAEPIPVSQSTLALNALGQQFAQAKAESDKQDQSVNAKIDQLTQSVNLLGQMIAKAQAPQTGGTN